MQSQSKNNDFPDTEKEENDDQTNTGSVDIHALAEEIIRLLKRELMIENERQGR
jgi:hypothetical protein